MRNFLSFSSREDGSAEEFSMIAGKVRSKREHVIDDGKLKLLKFAAVYGANASGKSNLVKAMMFMRETVVSGFLERYSDKYCKVGLDNKEKASYFEVEIVLNGKYYAYGFEIILSKGEFVSEWLVELRADNSERVIFERDILKGSYELGKNFKCKELLHRLMVYADDIKDDSSVLFLTIMNKNKKNFYKDFKEASALEAVYWWLNQLNISFPEQQFFNSSRIMQEENLDDVCNIISSLGTGITGYKLIEVPIEQFQSVFTDREKKQISKEIVDGFANFQKNVRLQEGEELKAYQMTIRKEREFYILESTLEKQVCKALRFYHGEEEVLYDFYEESDGTNRIFDLLEILLAEEKSVFIVDELDRCLHPSLTYRFIETFLDYVKKKNIQLIVTTHESRLLDFDLLRRDEIWFVNKRATGESDIYSLEEYNTRFDQKIDKVYLEGRYGGVPIFSTVFPIREE